jgi:hypothetical protein
MIQQTEPTTNSRRLQVDETEKVSSTICCQDRGWLWDRVGSDRLGCQRCWVCSINREVLPATSAFIRINDADAGPTSWRGWECLR